MGRDPGGRDAERPFVADTVFGAAAPAVLRGTTFERCRFERTVLQAADLGGCRFLDCTFDGVNLSGATVDDVVLQGCLFTACKAVAIDFSRAARITATRFDECLLDDCAFVECDLRHAAMSRCRLRRTVFTGADLRDADLSRTDLSGAVFGRTRLGKADLRGATGYAIHPSENDLRGARVSLPEAAALLAALGIEVHG